MKLCKYQQYTFREGSFVFRNLSANFRVTLLLTVHFAIYFHAKLSFVNFSMKNIRDKIMSLSSINVNLHQVFLPVHLFYLFQIMKSKLIPNEKFFMKRNNFFYEKSYRNYLDIRTLRRHSVLL